MASRKGKEGLGDMPLPPMDKDSWENVPQIVTQAVRILAGNFSKIQSWSVKVENRLKNLDERALELMTRIEVNEEYMRQIRSDLDSQAEQAEASNLAHGEVEDALQECLWGQLEAVRTVFRRLCQSFGAELALRDHGGARDLQALRSVCGDLESSLERFGGAFDEWDSARSQEKQRSLLMQSTLDEMRGESEQVQKRLWQWREMLKENTAVIECLSDSLITTQTDVRGLQDEQVKCWEVQSIVDQRAEELQGQQQEIALSVDRVNESHLAYRSELEGSIQALAGQTEELVREHRGQVSQMLEQNLTPITAYLNTMHVKADDARTERNDIVSKLSQLSERIEEAFSALARADGEGSRARDELSGSIAGLANAVDDGRKRAEEDRAEWLRALAEHSEEFQKHCTRSNVLENQTAVNAKDKDDKITGLSKHLHELEQKVAKWVHSYPLPAKMSEARLYALEARLNEEMSARLNIEGRINEERLDDGLKLHKRSLVKRDDSVGPPLGGAAATGLPPMASPRSHGDGGAAIGLPYVAVTTPRGNPVGKVTRRPKPKEFRSDTQMRADMRTVGIMPAPTATV